MKCTVLVVDDEADIRMILEELLSLQGFNVCTAGSVREAQSQLEVHQIDLIISDVMMPDVRGTELRSYVLKDSRYKSLPFIYMTGFAPISEQLTGYVLGKPFDFDGLMSIINRAMMAAQGEKLDE
jgi:DNA-binding NtrC family response regulator